MKEAANEQLEAIARHSVKLAETDARADYE